MEMFNYVMVLASVIIGLGIAHLLQGVGGIVQHPRREKIYWVHLLWVAAIFLRAIFWWWFEFRLSETPEWTFTLYLFVLAYAVLIYLWCALLFPRDLAGYDGFKDYYLTRAARWFFGLLLAGQAIDVADTLLKGLDHFRSLGPSYVVAIAILSVQLLVAMRNAQRTLSRGVRNLCGPLSDCLPIVGVRHGRLAGAIGWEKEVHRSRINGILIDCNVDDIQAAARFWAEALGRPIDPDHPGTLRQLRDARNPARPDQHPDPARRPRKPGPYRYRNRRHSGRSRPARETRRDG